MVNGHKRVYVERRGRIEPTEVRFASEQSLRDAIERILTPLGRSVDELSPMVDARLDDGSRVHRPPRSLRSTARDVDPPLLGAAAGPTGAGRLRAR